MNPVNLSKILSALGSSNQKSNYKGILTNCPMSHRHEGGGDSHPSFFAYYSDAKKTKDTSFGYCHACGFKGTITEIITEIMISSGRDMSKLLHQVYLAEWCDDVSNVFDIPMYEDVPNHVRLAKDKKEIVKSKRKLECSYFVLPNGEEIPLVVNGIENNITNYDIEKMCSSWIGNKCDYFIDRGLNEQDMIDWGLGYAGIIRYRKFKNNKWYYSCFKSRAIFSVKDEDGHIVGWSARRILETDKYTYSDHLGIKSAETFGGPKYLHAQGFVKTHALYGLHRVDKTCNIAILCEGFFDAIKISKAGFKNVFALMGGDLSAFQKDYIVRNFKKVIFFEDGDKAGVDISGKAKSKLSNDIGFVAVDSVKEGYYKDKGGRDPGDMNENEIRSILGNYI